MARNPASVDGNDEAARVDAVATPATVAVRVSIPSPSVSIRQHGWVQWALIAIEHEESARRARKAEKVNEHLPGLVAIAAAAFALDALYGLARKLILSRRWIRRRNAVRRGEGKGLGMSLIDFAGACHQASFRSRGPHGFESSSGSGTMPFTSRSKMRRPCGILDSARIPLPRPSHTA